MNKNKIVTILRGIPGSGKSHVADTLCELNSRSGKTSQICCTDYFFYDLEGNYNWDLEQIGTAHLWCLHEFKNALADGVEAIIVANTNVKNADIKAYRDLAVEAGYIVYVLTVENWHNGQDVHDVPIEIKLGMSETLKQNVQGFEMPMIEYKGVMKPAYKRNKDTGLFEKVDYDKIYARPPKKKYTPEEIEVLRQNSTKYKNKQLKNN